jgi:hypothetical protein
VLDSESDYIQPTGRGSVPKGNYHNKLPFYSSESHVLNKKSDFIRLRRTDIIINGVKNFLFHTYFFIGFMLVTFPVVKKMLLTFPLKLND